MAFFANDSIVVATITLSFIRGRSHKYSLSLQTVIKTDGYQNLLE
jgi:hypothetical protein